MFWTSPVGLLGYPLCNAAAADRKLLWAALITVCQHAIFNFTLAALRIQLSAPGGYSSRHMCAASGPSRQTKLMFLTLFSHIQRTDAFLYMER
jgi:hypothetical protein